MSEPTETENAYVPPSKPSNEAPPKLRNLEMRQPPSRFAVLAYIPAGMIGFLMTTAAFRGLAETFAPITDSPSEALTVLSTLNAVFLMLTFLWRIPRHRCTSLTKHSPTLMASFVVGFVANTLETATFEIFLRLGILKEGGPRADNEFWIFLIEVAVFLILSVEIEAWLSCKSQGLPYFTSKKTRHVPSDSPPNVA